ncbi:hypothetical protein AVEN_190279-1 [Araneus ventricosus]|uniref:Uncharacterized protein n=1 Tax=Araneus ventricosus TaxID=182803 RepID=A0A4Y2IUL5_ARAVE|nr:hypothetical protein AVEN_190279-1 [Araneus ventricosus]
MCKDHIPTVNQNTIAIRRLSIVDYSDCKIFSGDAHDDVHGDDDDHDDVHGGAHDDGGGHGGGDVRDGDDVHDGGDGDVHGDGDGRDGDDGHDGDHGDGGDRDDDHGDGDGEPLQHQRLHNWRKCKAARRRMPKKEVQRTSEK